MTLQSDLSLVGFHVVKFHGWLFWWSSIGKSLTRTLTSITFWFDGELGTYGICVHHLWFSVSLNFGNDMYPWNIFHFTNKG